MDERGKFEQWFAETTGVRPQGDVVGLRCQLADLKIQIKEVETVIDAIRRWEDLHQTALYAWREGQQSAKSDVASSTTSLKIG